MSIELIPGFQANIQIKDQQGNLLLEKGCASKEEVQAFVKEYGQSKSWGLLDGLVMPLRTQNSTEFAQDLFLPTFVHVALQVNNIVLKVIVSILTIVLDVMTLPIRFIATPFRMYYQAHYPEEKNHPLTQLIHENGRAVFDDPVVELCYEVQEVCTSRAQEKIVFPKSWSASSCACVRELLADGRKSVIKGAIQVALQTMPYRMDNGHSEVLDTEVYSKESAGWKLEGNYKYFCPEWGDWTWIGDGILTRGGCVTLHENGPLTKQAMVADQGEC